MKIKVAGLSTPALVFAATLGTTTSFTVSLSISRTILSSDFEPHLSSSVLPVKRWASRSRHGFCDVVPPPHQFQSRFRPGPRLESGADACNMHPTTKIKNGGITTRSETELGLAAEVKKSMKAVGLMLAWYLASTAAALAVSGATGLPYEPRPRRRMPIAPMLLLLYVISDKKIKTRNRFDGVVPQDDQSRQRLADDAYDMAISWGKPAGRIALLAVDMLSFLLIFRFSGYDFSKLLAGRGMEQLMSVEFWIPNGAAATLGAFGITITIRRFGHGYIRSTAATMLAPFIRNAIIKPTKAVAALFGAGSDWDLGISDEEHAERRASSRRLRESLSTFQDVNFAEGNGSGGGREGGVPALDLGNHGSDEEGEGRDKGGAPPPNLKRTK